MSKLFSMVERLFASQRRLGKGRRPGKSFRPRLELLETRLTPAVTLSYVDDNWHFVSDADSSGTLSYLDEIRNDNDTINPGTITAFYGLNGFGIVTTGTHTGSLPAYDSISDAVTGTISGGTVDVLEGSYTLSPDLTIDKGLTLKGANAGVAGTSMARGVESVLNGPTNAIGIYVTTTSAVTVDGIEFVGNSIREHVPGASVTWKNSIFDTTVGVGGPGNGLFVSNPVAFNFTDNKVLTDDNLTNFIQVEGNYAGTGANSPVNITGNNFSGTGSPNLNAVSVNVNNVQGTIAGNTFDAVDIGVLVAGASGNIGISSNTFKNIARGAVENASGSYGAGVVFFNPTLSGLVTISNNIFEDNDAAMRTSTSGGGPFTLNDATVSIAGNTFTGNLFEIVDKFAGTLTPTGTNVFDGVTLSTATTNQLFAIEDKIVDSIDVSGYGLVRLKAANVYVTPNSFFVPGGTTTADIQRAVDSATTGDIVHIQGGSYTGNVSSTGKAITFDIGASPAQVALNGNFTLDAMDTLPVDIIGTGAGTGFDQLVVTGTVTLGGSMLVLTAGVNVPPGRYVIINNDGGDAVSGTFAGLPQGSIITLGDQKFQISYVGGTGNDVTLTLAGFTPAVPSPSAKHGGTFKPGQAQYADVSGDGKADLIFQNNNNVFFLSLGTSTGFGAPTQVAQHGGTFKAGQAQYADVSGDGKADLIYQGTDNSFWLSLSTGAGFGAPTLAAKHGGTFIAGQAQYADVSGDGKADLIYQTSNNAFLLSLSTGTGFGASAQVAKHGGTFKAGQAQYANVNGGNMADLIYQGNDNSFWLSLSTGTGFGTPVLAAKHGGTFIAGQAQYADVSGDNMADLIFQTNNNAFLLSLSTGTAFGASAQVAKHGGTFMAGQAQYTDVNGDGKADLMFGGQNNDFWMSLSNGTGFGPTQKVVDHAGAFMNGAAQYADVNGDGLADLILQDPDNSFWLWFATAGT